MYPYSRIFAWLRGFLTGAGLASALVVVQHASGAFMGSGCVFIHIDEFR